MCVCVCVCVRVCACVCVCARMQACVQKCARVFARGDHARVYARVCGYACACVWAREHKHTATHAPVRAVARESVCVCRCERASVLVGS